MNRGYGYYWWLSGESPTLDSVTFEDKPGGMHHFGPDDSYCAVGLGSQMIEVVPSLDMVIVRMGTAPHDDLANWLDPEALYDDLIHDGEQIVHNGVLERVLGALITP
jgi:CubicO group peptidase (beta-lactamase class C family)